jgi:hypothetical protein
MSLLYPGASAATVAKWISLMAEAARKAEEWAKVKDYRDYYSGNHPVYLTHRQEEYLGKLLTEANHTVAHNLCATVVDVLRERLCVTGFTADDEAGTEFAAEVMRWWDAAGMDKHQITVHRRALRDGASYLILDWDAEKQQPVWVPNRRYDGDTGVVYHRDPETDAPAMAIKYWRVDDPLSDEYGKARRTVYLPDAILRQKADAGNTAGYGWSDIDPAEGQAFVPWTLNGMVGGEPIGIACIEFQNPGGVSEIESVIGLQNALNKTWLDVLAAADAHGFPLLKINYPGPAPAGNPDDENATADDITIRPGNALELFNGSDAGRIEPGNITQLLELIDRLTGAISGTSRTPQYYLRPFGGSDVPSGEALKQLESGLVSRARERHVSFGDSWAEAIRIGGRVAYRQGMSVPLDVRLKPQWKSPEIRYQGVEADTAIKEKQLGIPDEFLWSERLGYDQQTVEKLKKMRAAEQAQAITNVLMQSGIFGGGNGQSATNGAGGNGQPPAAAGAASGAAGEQQQRGTAGR